MKELSIEEKAKHYDEAYKKVAVRFGSNVADEIFPELKESEDEKIRKQIKAFIKTRGSHITQSKTDAWIAWLEKKPSLLTKEKALKNSPFVEQNSAWSEEDEDYYDAIIAKLEVTQDDALLTDNQMKFLKSLKDRVQPKQKKL